MIENYSVLDSNNVSVRRVRPTRFSDRIQQFSQLQDTRLRLNTPTGSTEWISVVFVRPQRHDKDGDERTHTLVTVNNGDRGGFAKQTNYRISIFLSICLFNKVLERQICGIFVFFFFVGILLWLVMAHWKFSILSNFVDSGLFKNLLETVVPKRKRKKLSSLLNGFTETVAKTAKRQLSVTQNEHLFSFRCIAPRGSPSLNQTTVEVKWGHIFSCREAHNIQ